jgi:hypothetical protein
MMQRLCSRECHLFAASVAVKLGCCEIFGPEHEGVFTTAWSATKTYRRLFRDWPESVCAENSLKFGTEKDAAVPTADKRLEQKPGAPSVYPAGSQPELTRFRMGFAALNAAELALRRVACFCCDNSVLTAATLCSASANAVAVPRICAISSSNAVLSTAVPIPSCHFATRKLHNRKS